MVLRAKVRRVLGQTAHLAWAAEGPVELCAPAAVEIVEAGGACYLLRKGADGTTIADTWHPTVDDAKEQARFEYGVAECDWSSDPDDT